MRGRRLRLLAVTVALTVVASPIATASSRRGQPEVRPTSNAIVEARIVDLAASLDHDLDRLFRFVADEIRYEPYVGILRGALGTLDAGAGNSVDKAVLLAALLNESGIQYRFARGPLDEAAAETLVRSSALDAAEARNAAELALAGGPYPESVDITPPGPADSQELAAVQAAADEALQASAELMTESVSLITDALAGAGIELGDGTATAGAAGTLPEAERNGHTWLQVASGAAWLDLDPTLGDQSAIGDILVPAAETLDVLPDDLRHAVRFEVLLEQVRGDRLEISTVIDYAGYADELAGEAITLAHVKPGALQGSGVNLFGGEPDLTYYPTLKVPGGSVVAADPIVFASADGGGGLCDDSGFFGDCPSPGIGEGEPSAEWLAVTVESPGENPVTARRAVFDRVAPEVRLVGEPTAADVQPIELIPFAADGDVDFAPTLGSDTFAISTGPTSSNSALERATASGADMGAILASSYLGLRDVIAAEHAIGDGVATFVDRPGVVSFSVDVGMSGDEPTVRFGLDIWHHGFGAIPITDGEVAPPHAALLAGVVEHVAERVALEAGSDPDSRDDRSVGVSRVFEAAALAGIPTLVIRGSMPNDVSYGAVATALIDEALRAGDVVIVPARPVTVGGQDRLGWWRVEPDTGATADMMDDGTASDFTEYTIVVRVAACLTAFAPAYFNLLWAILDGAASKLAGVGAALYTGFWIVYSTQLPVTVAACLTGAPL